MVQTSGLLAGNRIKNDVGEECVPTVPNSVPSRTQRALSSGCKTNDIDDTVEFMELWNSWNCGIHGTVEFMELWNS
ncbi:unnamed protein product [Adineta ricciae]|uniref:Uncharacterized protein n=1 Tax=Adineta ricciae TaxID=249248 RepID=A0A815TBN0_ADIRI|nr:unnamed protein product [Adineta ricciae]CAF1501574.1 unnamed protein product [Adineta ricciae]